MSRSSPLLPIAAGLAVLLVSGAACDVNKNVDIAPGAQSGGRSTVNGSIDVGRDAVVDGDLETVNGSIRIGENARIEDAQTVNGRIHLAAGVAAGAVETVNGSVTVGEKSTLEEISAVNGEVELDRGARVTRHVGNVNGDIRVTGGEIGGDLETFNGDVSVTEGAHLAGDLAVRKPRGSNLGERRMPRILIGPGARVDGEIVLEREVELYISETADVGGVSGVMSMADAVRFSGDRP